MAQDVALRRKPDQVLVHIVPGVASRAIFGARGFGQVDLQCLQLAGAGLAPCVDMGVRNRGRRLGQTDVHGRFAAQLPAGANRLDLDLADRYLVSGSPSFVLPVLGTATVKIVVASHASVTVSFSGLKDPSGIALTLLEPGEHVLAGQPPARFAYTDETGSYEFVHLKVGSYRVRVENLPAGYELATTGLAFNLASGERRALKLVLTAKRK